ncbi:MAG: 50S ribosomal protein L30 [bacterium]|jgi:large subunit ribosomal protein L30
MANTLKITLERSAIGLEKSQGLTANALGLTKRGKTVHQPDNASIRGMCFKIRHLVSVEEIKNGEEAK